jgi:uncharacterized protein (DUF2147 family)
MVLTALHRAPHRARMAALRRSIAAAMILAALAFGAARAGTDASPLGTWTTIDDVSHKPRALVEISEHDGVLSGRIVRLFREPDEDPDPRCEDCTGPRHDQRVLGMTILWDLHRRGENWDGGEILDPETGSIYRCTLRTSADGGKLEVRGFIGISLLGRTQVWSRAAP